MTASRHVVVLVENQPVPRDRRVWQVARALTRAGIRVTVVGPQGDEHESLREELESVSIRRFPLRPSAGAARDYVREYGVAMRAMRRIVNEVAAADRVDVVHACNPPDTLLLTALGARRRGAALVFDHHDLVPELLASRFGDRRLLRRGTLLAERLTFALADVVISTNDSYRRVALTRGKKRPDDVFVVRNAPDLSSFRPGEPREAQSNGARHVLVYVGVMGPQDGIDHALRALGELARERRDWRAVFVGEGEVLEDMRALADELAVADLVEFTGWVEPDRVAEIVASATVCIAPDPPSPLNDVSSMIKVVEYMAMAKPIASFALAETRVSAGDAALYAADSSPAALASVISELLDDPGLRARMGAEGRRRIEAGLAWQHQERALLAAYDRAFAVADRRRS